MKIYHYHPITKELLGVGKEERISKLEKKNAEEIKPDKT